MARSFLPRCALGAAAIVAGLVAALTALRRLRASRWARRAPGRTTPRRTHGRAHDSAATPASGPDAHPPTTARWSSDTTPDLRVPVAAVRRRPVRTALRSAAQTAQNVRPSRPPTAERHAAASSSPATNASGSTAATSAQTAVITTAGPQGARSSCPTARPSVSGSSSVGTARAADPSTV